MFSKTLKIFAVALLFISSTPAISQTTKEISQEWVSFSQQIDIQTKEKVKFKLRAYLKTVGKKSNSAATLFTWVQNKDEESGVSRNIKDSVLNQPQWTPYEIEGDFDQNAESLTIGAWVVSDGDFYFDNFELFFQKEGEEYKPVTIANPDFENTVVNDNIPGWIQMTRGKDTIVKVKGYKFVTSERAYKGKSALMIKGREVERDSSNYITTKEGFSPQIGVLISMLNNLSNRVERVVKDLDIRQTDHLLDKKANRIGALIMHLAAAAAYYQVYTFENRSFNKEEKVKWETGLDLGEKAREEFKEKPITYYLDIYKEVRKKTIEELGKRNDEWLEKSGPGLTMNNHFAWFHVMEHQSSHLGQILMLKKRIPEEENDIKLPEEKVDQ